MTELLQGRRAARDPKPIYSAAVVSGGELLCLGRTVGEHTESTTINLTDQDSLRAIWYRLIPYLK